MWKLKTASDLAANKIVAIRGRTIVGRSAEAEIQIKKSEISREHAQLDLQGELLTLKDLGSVNGTFVNGGRLTEPKILKAGDRLRFEEIEFEVLPFSQEEEVSSSNATGVSSSVNETQVQKAFAAETVVHAAVDLNTKLTLVRGESQEKVFYLDGIHQVKIGRSSKCDVVLDDLTVSGEHAKIVNGEGGWEIVNLSQTNGLFVNGNKLLKHFLSSGDMVELGGAVLRFETKDETELDEKVKSSAKIPDWVRHQT